MVDASEGNDEAVKSFAKLGISLSELVNGDGSFKSVDEILPQIADGMQRLGSQAERIDIAQALFGRGGISLVPMLQGFELSLAAGGLLLLGVLNWIGIRESAQVSATVAMLAFAALLLIGVTATHRRGGSDKARPRRRRRTDRRRSPAAASPPSAAWSRWRRSRPRWARRAVARPACMLIAIAILATCRCSRRSRPISGPRR
jgi:hypothetical protein